MYVLSTEIIDVNIENNAVKVKKARKRLRGRQITFQTPLKELNNFVSSIRQFGFESYIGTAYIEQYVIEPKTTNSILMEFSKEAVVTSNTCIKTESSSETDQVLAALLSDWIDFIFLFDDSKFGIYADHDEYCTFYSRKSMELSNLKIHMSSSGFKHVPGYERSFS